MMLTAGLQFLSMCCINVLPFFFSVSDLDVLDTWFSSGLFPFAMLGWPEQVVFQNKPFWGLSPTIPDLLAKEHAFRETKM